MSEPVKHTPGPWLPCGWLTGGLLSVYAVTPEGSNLGYVALVHGLSAMPPPEQVNEVVAGYKTPDHDPVAVANARLIASAPDLLDACEAAAESLEGSYHRGDQRLRERLLAAIAKAKGGA